METCIYKLTFADGCWIKLEASVETKRAHAAAAEYLEPGESYTLERVGKSDAAAIKLARDTYARMHGFLRLQGPCGTVRGGEAVTRSRFERIDRPAFSGWRWAAFNAENRVVALVEYPDAMPGMWETTNGALWALRECAASYFHDVRAHRGH